MFGWIEFWLVVYIAFMVTGHSAYVIVQASKSDPVSPNPKVGG